MLKFGIVTVERLSQPYTWFGKQRHTSFLLLQHLFETKHEEAQAYDELVRRVLLPNGIWKQTAHGRLRDVDKLLLGLLQERYASGSRLSVIDLAASTGVTSLDLYETLHPWYIVDFIAGDLYRDLFAICFRSWPVAVILDHSGVALQYVIGRFVLPGQLSESWLYPINRFLKRCASITLLPQAQAAFRRYPDRNQATYFVPRSLGSCTICRLPFFSYRCLSLMERHPNFRFEIIDILRPITHRAMVVRAMNIVTPDYFDETRACLAIRNCLAAVETGGMLVMGQSPSLAAKDVRATVYSIDRPHVTVRARLNGGCKMEHLVLHEATMHQL